VEGEAHLAGLGPRRAPLVGRVIDKAGHTTVERGAESQSVADADRVTSALRKGVSVLVFPEGTFVRPPKILPFRLETFKAAVETGCPVVPVTIRGTRHILPAGTWVPRPGPMTVIVGSPTMPSGRQWADMGSLRDRTRAEIARQAGEPFVSPGPARVSRLEHALTTPVPGDADSAGQS
jgi:1-acyl-sn-glycerol-3-phosphate acyltransferase